MDKNKLIEIKKRLLALGVVCVMLGTTGCSTDKKDEDKIPKPAPISSDYSEVDNYYKYIVRDGKPTKVYKAKNICLLFDKKTYEVEEYIFDYTFFGSLGGQIYDLESEKLLVYSNGIGTRYNYDYYEYIVENNYQVPLLNVSDYVEGHESKEYYSLDEIKELEPQICESLKILNKTNNKTKKH